MAPNWREQFCSIQEAPSSELQLVLGNPCLSSFRYEPRSVELWMWGIKKGFSLFLRDLFD
jgi:hypothetical protein